MRGTLGDIFEFLLSQIHKMLGIKELQLWTGLQGWFIKGCCCQQIEIFTVCSHQQNLLV